VLSFLAGDTTEEAARADTVQATRRFARRQHGWFGKDERIGWVPFDADDRLERALTYHRRS
jgi:tRNA dimethylallyltransferase